jgi:hypothetical protein
MCESLQVRSAFGEDIVLREFTAERKFAPQGCDLFNVLAQLQLRRKQLVAGLSVGRALVGEADRMQAHRFLHGWVAEAG